MTNDTGTRLGAHSIPHMIDPGNGSDIREATDAEADEAIDLWRFALTAYDKSEPLGARAAREASHLCDLAIEVYPKRHLALEDSEREYATALGLLAVTGELANDLEYAKIDRGLFMRHARMVSWARGLVASDQGGVLGFAARVSVAATDRADATPYELAVALAGPLLVGLGRPVVAERLRRVRAR